jgi:hypothetical protein
VDVTGNITAKICEVWSEFNIFCTLVRNNIHIWWNEISQKKSESVGQTLLQLPWSQKREDLKMFWIPFIKLHDNGSHFEKINPFTHNFTWHMIILQSFIKFDQGIFEK